MNGDAKNRVLAGLRKLFHEYNQELRPEVAVAYLGKLERYGEECIIRALNRHRQNDHGSKFPPSASELSELCRGISRNEMSRVTQRDGHAGHAGQNVTGRDGVTGDYSAGRPVPYRHIAGDEWEVSGVVLDASTPHGKWALEFAKNSPHTREEQQQWIRRLATEVFR